MLACLALRPVVVPQFPLFYTFTNYFSTLLNKTTPNMPPFCFFVCLFFFPESSPVYDELARLTLLSPCKLLTLYLKL